MHPIYARLFSAGLNNIVKVSCSRLIFVRGALAGKIPGITFCSSKPPPDTKIMSVLGDSMLISADIAIDKLLPEGEIAEKSVRSIGLQCGNALTVDEENIVVLQKCFSPPPDLSDDAEPMNVSTENLSEARNLRSTQLKDAISTSVPRGESYYQPSQSELEQRMDTGEAALESDENTNKWARWTRNTFKRRKPPINGAQSLPRHPKTVPPLRYRMRSTKRSDLLFTIQQQILRKDGARKETYGQIQLDIIMAERRSKEIEHALQHAILKAELKEKEQETIRRDRESDMRIELLEVELEHKKYDLLVTKRNAERFNMH